MKHLRYLLMAALVAMPLTACDEDDEPVIVEPDIGTITGTVSVAGTGLAGIDVTLVGATSQSVQTSSSGTYTFASVEAGSYGVTISNIPAGVSFSTTSKTTAITTDGQTVTVDFTGSYIETSSIIGTVTVAGQGINGVSVALTGTETGNSVTANGGNFSFSGLRAGSYTVTISNIPTAYTFQTLSYPVTLGVGEAKSVAFVGEEVVTVDPVTAEVVIKSVTTGTTNTPVNPNAVVGQIDVTLQVDPGENDLTSLELMLDGVVVASQTYASAVAGDLPEQQGGIFEVVFSINTAAFDATTGMVDWTNGSHALSAELGLANAEAASVTTSTDLVFANVNMIMAEVIPANTAIGSGGLAPGNLWYGGASTNGNVQVRVVPVLYSAGKSLNSATVTFTGNGTTRTASAPFPATVTFTNATGGQLIGYQSAVANTDQFTVTAPVYADGTAFAGSPWIATGPNGAVHNIDNVAPVMNVGQIFALTEQVSGTTHPTCCANNWVNPNYAFSGGIGTFADAGVGGADETYHMGLASLSPTQLAALAAVATPGETGLGPSLVNTEYEVVTVLMDLLGNKSAPIALSASPNADNGAQFIGHDAAAPVNQALAAGSQADKFIYNLTNLVAGAPVQFQGQEDRAGFSLTPLRLWIKRRTATTTTYQVGASATSGGFVNEAAVVPACNTAVPVNGTPCMPDGTMAVNAIYTLTGHLVDQAGNEVATDIVRQVMVDGTAPTTQNVSIPTSVLVGGASTPFGYNVSDDLHLWEVSLGFDYAGAGIYIPFGNPVNVGDGDKWDENFPRNAQDVINAPLIVGIQLVDAAHAPAGAVLPAFSVRAVTEDAAGNQSGNANAFAVGTVPAGTTFGTTGTFSVTAPAAAVDLCNGLGATACATGDVKSVQVTATATGPSGTYVNPFLSGNLYFYYVVDADATLYNGGETYFLLGSVPGTGALFTDDGVTRTYTWTFTVTSAMMDVAPLGALNLHVIGTSANGTGLLTNYNTNVTVVNGF